MITLEYKVKLGDTLTQIAERYHVSVDEIARLNGIKDVRLLWIGDRLKIPVQSPPTTRPVAPVIPEAGVVGSRTAVSQDANRPTPSSPLSSLLLGSGREVGCLGRVRHRNGVNLYDAPTGRVMKTLRFNTRLFVARALQGNWYFVTLDDGGFGYVNQDYLSLHPPEPNAVLHEIKKGESALDIVRQHYKSAAMSWGQDERFYVNVLVEANRGTGPTGIYTPSGSGDWSQTQTRESYLIWVPSLEFAKGLRGKVTSGSISYELWNATRQAAGAVEDFLLSSGAFVAGVLHGALESVWDLLTGLIDLIRLAWDVLKSVFTLELFSDVRELWEIVKALNVSALVDAGLEHFKSRWNNPSLLHRWHFRGWVTGYAIAEILMAVLTGSAALVKWAGKAGKFSKFISKFPKVLRAAEKVTEASKRIPAEAGQRLKKVLAKHLEDLPPGRQPRIPWSGARYVEEVEPVSAKKYEEIRELTHDFLRMNKYTGISKRILERVHTHLFHTIHDLPVGPNKVLRGHFTPDAEIATLWLKATQGKLTKEEANVFRRIVAHEYIESRLMEKGGLPYRSAHPDAWSDGINMPNPKHHGAHDLAPLVDYKRPPFAHWKTVTNLAPPESPIWENLSNLDKLVEDILKKRNWKK